MRIAIVDDLAAERTLLKDRLEQQLQRRNVQADILEYESGETFLEAARKAPFTAAFLDRWPPRSYRPGRAWNQRPRDRRRPRRWR